MNKEYFENFLIKYNKKIKKIFKKYDYKDNEIKLKLIKYINKYEYYLILYHLYI